MFSKKPIPAFSVIPWLFMSAVVLLYKLFYWQGDLDVRLQVWEKCTSLVWALKSHFAFLDTMGTQTLISKLKLAAGNKRGPLLWPHPPPPSPILQEHLSVSLKSATPIIYGLHHHQGRQANMLSPERSAGASKTHNNSLRKHWILKGWHFLEGGSWLSSKLLLHFYIKSQLECQMSFPPSPDTARQCTEKNKEEEWERLHECHNNSRGKNKAKNVPRCCWYIGTLHHIH